MVFLAVYVLFMFSVKLRVTLAGVACNFVGVFLGFGLLCRVGGCL